MAKEVKINPHTNKPIEDYPKWVDSKRLGKKIIVDNEMEEAQHTADVAKKPEAEKPATVKGEWK